MVMLGGADIRGRTFSAIRKVLNFVPYKVCKFDFGNNFYEGFSVGFYMICRENPPSSSPLSTPPPKKKKKGKKKKEKEIAGGLI